MTQKTDSPENPIPKIQIFSFIFGKTWGHTWLLPWVYSGFCVWGPCDANIERGLAALRQVS